MQFQIAGSHGQGGIWEFINYMEGRALLKRKWVKFDVVRYQ